MACKFIELKEHKTGMMHHLNANLIISYHSPQNATYVTIELVGRKENFLAACTMQYLNLLIEVLDRNPVHRK